jgi:plasmid stabilization system protein ParE
MTQPTHGLDPNALEAALSVKLVGQFWPGETAIESEDHNWSAYRAERYAQIITAYLASLSQNPGTSNTSGEAGPVAWRFKADDPHYDDAYVYCATEEMALLRCPKNSKVEPLYASLEPRASDREAVTDEMVRAGAFAAWASTTPFAGLTEAAFRAKSDQHVRSADLGGGTTLEQDMLLDWELNTDTFCVLARATLEAAIRKLSEVSHEH